MFALSLFADFPSATTKHWTLKFLKTFDTEWGGEGGQMEGVALKHVRYHM